MLDTSYLSYPFAIVPRLTDFYRDSGTLPEIPIVRNLINAIKSVFKVPANRVQLWVGQGIRAYRFDIYDNSKMSIASIVYLPETKRLDLFDNMISSDIPLIQWKNKRMMSKNYSTMADMVGYGKLFQPIAIHS